MSKRIWVVSELYYPEETSTGWFLSRIAEGLADDAEVHAICSRPTYSERARAVPYFERHAGVAVHRMRSSRFGKDQILGRLVNLATFSFTAFLFAIFRVNRDDCILVVTNPPSMPLLMGLVARFRRARSVLLIHDVYPEILVATGTIPKSGIVERVIRVMMLKTYRFYDRIIVLGRDMQDVVSRHLGEDCGKIVIIPNWGDTDEIVPLAYKDNLFAREKNPDNACVIQFSGNLGRTHNVEEVLAAAHALRSEPAAIFQFIGEGGKSDLVRRAAATLPGNVQVLPRQPRDNLNEMLAAASAAIIAFVPGMRGLSVPSRMYNVMAAGTPIIAMTAADSELGLVVSEEVCGWVLAPDDIAGLIDLARYLTTSKGRADARERGANGRQAVVRRFSRSTVQDEYRRLFREL